jgi:galactose mutarotase-like enzyme
VRISCAKHGSFESLTLENEWLRLVLLPELGAKITSLVDLERGREWLSAPGGPDYRRAGGLDTEFGASDANGWDECFPSVGPGFHFASPWEGVRLADHGELWTRPWSWHQEDDALVTEIRGARFPYQFERRLSLEGSVVRVSYAVTNLTEFPFPCVWSMHPLFAAKPGMRIVLPEPLRVMSDYSTSTFGYLERFDWPIGRASGRSEIDFSTLMPPESRFAIKLTTTRLERGRAALCDPASGDWLGLSWDTSVVPFLGVWLNQSGWPAQDGLYHVALEPMTGAAADLGVAAALGDSSVLPGGGSLRWTVDLNVSGASMSVDAFVAS